MDLIKEYRNSKVWLHLNNSPLNAANLDYVLVTVDFKDGRKEEICVPNTLLQQLTGLSREELADTRKLLVKFQLKLFKQGKRGKKPRYQRISLVDSK